jgi:hypothetical protein
MTEEVKKPRNDVDIIYRNHYDFELRECIGKTEDREVPLCQHASIVAREMAEKGVTVCRVCGDALGEGKGRYNDHKVLRNPLCVQPICVRCADERPDVFHKSFKAGLARMGVGAAFGLPPLHLEAARMEAGVYLASKGGV